VFCTSLGRPIGGQQWAVRRHHLQQEGLAATIVQALEQGMPVPRHARPAQPVGQGILQTRTLARVQPWQPGQQGTLLGKRRSVHQADPAHGHVRPELARRFRRQQAAHRPAKQGHRASPPLGPDGVGTARGEGADADAGPIGLGARITHERSGALRRWQGFQQGLELLVMPQTSRETVEVRHLALVDRIRPVRRAARHAMQSGQRIDRCGPPGRHGLGQVLQHGMHEHLLQGQHRPCTLAVPPRHQAGG